MDNLPTRLNNPGALKYAGQQGAEQDTTGFAKFQNPGEGGAALLNDIQAKIQRNPNQNLVDFSKEYAPESDGNNPGQYAANLANKLGVSPAATLASLQPKIGQFAEAIGSNEGFKDSNTNPQNESKTDSTPNLDKLLWGLGGAAVTGGAALLGGIEGIAKKTLPVAGTAIGGYFGNPVLGEVAGQGLADMIPGQQGSPTQDQPSQGTTQQASSPLSILDSQIPQAHQASQTLLQTLMQTLQTTKTGRELSQDPNVQEAMQANAKYGLAPEINNGNMDFSSALKKSNSLVSDMSNNVAAILEKEGGTAHMKEAINEANNYINKFVPDAQREEARGYVTEQIQKYYKENEGKGGQMGIGAFHRMKSQEGHGKKWGLLESTARKAGAKALAIGARRTVENHTKHKDFYNAIMKEESNLIRGQKLLKKMNGRKAPHNESLKKMLLHEGGRLMGVFIGDKIGGPLGSVMGNVIANKIIRAVDKRHGKTLFETPEMRHGLQILKSKNPPIYEVMKRELEKAGIKEEGKKLVDTNGVQKIPSEKGLVKKLLEKKSAKNKSTARSKPYTPGHRR